MRCGPPSETSRTSSGLNNVGSSAPSERRRSRRPRWSPRVVSSATSNPRTQLPSNRERTSITFMVHASSRDSRRDDAQPYEGRPESTSPQLRFTSPQLKKALHPGVTRLCRTPFGLVQAASPDSVLARHLLSNSTSAGPRSRCVVAEGCRSDRRNPSAETRRVAVLEHGPVQQLALEGGEEARPWRCRSSRRPSHRAPMPTARHALAKSPLVY